MFDINAAKNNMCDDLKHAKAKELESIYSDLVRLIKKYDDDGIFKDLKDCITLWFTPSLRQKCSKIFSDLIEEYEKIKESQRKHEFECDVASLVNIHKSVLEKLGELFKGL